MFLSITLHKKVLPVLPEGRVRQKVRGKKVKARLLNSFKKGFFAFLGYHWPDGDVATRFDDLDDDGHDAEC
jgi:hypothetical protein